MIPNDSSPILRTGYSLVSCRKSSKTPNIFMLPKHLQQAVLLAISLILVSGCATTSTGAVAAGPDTFVVSRQAGAFPSGREPLLTEALAEAASTCASLKKTLKVMSTSENPGPYIFGNYPKATVIFSCT
jgi:hypothetical protein